MNIKINDRINIRDIKFFNEFSLDLKYDSVASMFGFNFYFDPKNADHRELSCVSHFHEAIVQHNGETLVTGYILSESFTRSSVKDMVSFSGYSKAGVLEDCEIPPSSYPLQSDNLNLREIAQKLIKPFKIKMVISDSVKSRMEIKYPTTTAKESQSVKSYLTELATQRNIVISHDVHGNLLFTAAKAKSLPIAHFENGLMGAKMHLTFSGQGLHSDITVMKQASSDGGNAAEYTIQNPYVPIVYRPRVIVQTSGDDISTKEAARNALAAELKNIVLTIETDRWEVNGTIIKPNNIISILAPELYLFKKTNWFIESVNYKGSPEAIIATLTCVLPEVYNEKYPVNVFVDPHKNSA